EPAARPPLQPGGDRRAQPARVRRGRVRDDGPRDPAHDRGSRAVCHRPDARDRGRARLRGRLLARARSQPHDLLLRRGEAMNALFGAMNLVLAASEAFQPQDEFELPAWVSIHIGPLDMSINKAVVYLFVGAAVTMILGIWVMRFGLALRPNRRQTIGESLYDLIYGQIAESSLPTKGLSLWFPYVAALFLFIWVVNLIGFIPLPISDEHFHVAGVELPTWGLYAATATLSVTLALALLTFIATHFEGIRFNGPIRYFKSWVPQGAPEPLLLDRK